MAARDTRTGDKKLETPSLFDYLDRVPAVKIGGVSPAYVEAVPLDDGEPADEVVSAESAIEQPLEQERAPEDVPSTDETDVGPTKENVAVVPDGNRKDVLEENELAGAAARKPRKSEPTDASAPPPPATRAASTRQRAKPVTAEALAAKQRDISVSEFFAKNRHLLGFDNKRKALLTTVKEAVDNSLDACEEARILPELHVDIVQLAEERFRVRARDNGPGIVRTQVPNIFGKLLYGSKFHRLKMARGQQGIGISAAGMYGMLTTGTSVHVTSRTGPKKVAHHFQIQIDTSKNKPDVIKDEEIEVEWERGTEVTIELIASYAKGRQSVDEYMEQTAIANPHALIYYTSPTREHREFPRGSEDLPDDPREIQPHPHGIELGVLMKMLKESKGVKLSGFLHKSFCRVSQTVAERICDSAGLSTKAAPNTIGTHDVEKLYEAMQSVRIMAPPTDCLAPIGVRNLLAGLLKEVKAEFYTATTRSPAVYRGNPFQIEIALAYGGKLDAEGSARVIRFANRVPLLYQQSGCAAFKSVLDVDWRNYGLSQPGGNLPTGPLVVMVHMASVWVPFTSESKEAIADYDEIRKEMKLALQECGRKLATYVRRRRRQRMEAAKRDIFGRYIPDVAESLATLTGASEERILRDLRMIAKHRTAEADVVLDEDGKPIEPAPVEPVSNRSAAVAPASSRSVAADGSSADVASGLRAGRGAGPASGRSVASAPRGRRGTPRGRKPAASAAPPPEDAEEAALNGDDSTIIVPENEPEDIPEDLFDENGNGNSITGKKRRKRRR
jgi:DNA topoisomerase-6 subunit B